MPEALYLLTAGCCQTNLNWSCELSDILTLVQYTSLSSKHSPNSTQNIYKSTSALMDILDITTNWNNLLPTQRFGGYKVWVGITLAMFFMKSSNKLYNIDLLRANRAISWNDGYFICGFIYSNDYGNKMCTLALYLFIGKFQQANKFCFLGVRTKDVYWLKCIILIRWLKIWLVKDSDGIRNLKHLWSHTSILSTLTVTGLNVQENYFSPNILRLFKNIDYNRWSKIIE